MKPDAEIREDVTGELHWDPQVWDPEAIGVAVKDEAVTLTGADRVVTEIEEAFRREAEGDARHIQVEMSDHTAELYGLVHRLSEAAAVPVVGRVESHLVVSP